MADNPRKLLYLSLTAKLSVLKTSGLINSIGRWNNQIGNEERERGIKTPNVLIQIENDFEGTTASNHNLQYGDVIVTCHIGINVVKTDIGTIDWDIMQGVYEELQGHKLTDDTYYEFTPLDRVDEKEDNNYDGYYHGIVKFKTYLKDGTKCERVEQDEITSSINTLNVTKEIDD